MSEPKTHDYTDRYWGHNCHVQHVLKGGKRLEACGWGEGIHQGDYLLFQNIVGSANRYRVKAIRYARDPSDMWFATLVFAPKRKRGAFTLLDRVLKKLGVPMTPPLYVRPRRW